MQPTIALITTHVTLKYSIFIGAKFDCPVSFIKFPYNIPSHILRFSIKKIDNQANVFIKFIELDYL